MLLTARGQARHHGASQQAGADEYLIKAISPLQPIKTIERPMSSAWPLAGTKQLDFALQHFQGKCGRWRAADGVQANRGAGQCDTAWIATAELSVGPKSPSVTVPFSA